MSELRRPEEKVKVKSGNIWVRKRDVVYVRGDDHNISGEH